MRATFTLTAAAHAAFALACRGVPVNAPPEDVKACISYLAEGRCELAEERARLSLEYGSANAEAHNCLGMVELSCRGDLEAAGALFKEALSIHPDFAQAHNNLGVTFLRRVPADLETACEEFAAAIEIDPDYLDARMNLGTCLLRRGPERFAEARSQLIRLLERDPQRADARLALGYMLLELGRYEESAEELRRCLEIDPRAASCAHDLGVAHLALGRCDEALRAFAGALRDGAREGVDLEARRGMEEAQRKCALEDGAVLRLLDLARREPGNAALHFDLGKLLAERGVQDGAVEEWSRAAKLDPTFCPAHHALAMSAHRVLDTEGTVAGCTRYLDCLRETKRPATDEAAACADLVRRLTR